MIGTLSGLPARTTAGFHIHSGYTCDDKDSVGGHYFEGMDTDPWTTTYTSDAHGAAKILLTMRDFTLMAAYPVLGRAVVAHSSLAKISCGLIGARLSSSTMSTTAPLPTATPEPTELAPPICGPACKWGPLAYIASAIVGCAFMFVCLCMA